jgi:hypothetical protein
MINVSDDRNIANIHFGVRVRAAWCGAKKGCGCLPQLAQDVIGGGCGMANEGINAAQQTR